MKKRNKFSGAALLAVFLLLAGTGDLFGQPFEIAWFTIDGGGGSSATGSFELDGTIGQFDAGPALAGGTFILKGGFWSLDQQAAVLLGDVNGDGTVDLLDVAPFVDAVAAGIYIPAADINEDGSVDLLDVEPFISLLSG